MYLDKLFNLNGKVAAVTGAGGHLCGEMVKAYARAGCKVAILDLRLEKAQKIEKEINDEGFRNTIALEIDVSKKSNFVSVLKKIIDKLGNIDIFINGAGINGSTPLLISQRKNGTQIWNHRLKEHLLGVK